jgi:hypothetical protein
MAVLSWAVGGIPAPDGEDLPGVEAGGAGVEEDGGAIGGLGHDFHDLGVFVGVFRVVSQDGIIFEVHEVADVQIPDGDGGGLGRVLVHMGVPAWWCWAAPAGGPGGRRTGARRRPHHPGSG